MDNWRCSLFSTFLLVIWISGAVGSPSIAATCEGVDGVPGDVDGDGFVADDDCDDADPGLWTTPGEASGLRATAGSPQTFVWDPVADPGGSSAAVRYDLLRSNVPADFVGHPSVTCIEPDDEDTTALDPESPAPGTVFFYLALARNDCGGGDPGVASDGTTRVAAPCDCAVVCDDGDPCTADTCVSGVCENPPVTPLILRQPAGAAVCDGDLAHFSVGVADPNAVSFQWFHDGNPVGTNSPLLFVPTGPGAGGTLVHVEVTDGCATVASEEAVLTVFAESASCAGGLDGQEAPNGAGTPALLSGEDCNANGMDDTIDLLESGGIGSPDPGVGPMFSGEDCNANGMDDTIDLLESRVTGSPDPGAGLMFSGEDCNANGMDDTIDLLESRGIGSPDSVVDLLFSGEDCNARGMDDTIDLLESRVIGSMDTVVDLLFSGEDCNANGEDDMIDLYSAGPSRGGVHLHSGEYWLRAADLVVRGRGLDFVWARTYRSREWRQTSMGVGWTHSHDRRVEIDPSDPLARRIHRGNGRIDTLLPGAPGCWEAPGFFEALCEEPGGAYTLTFADKTVWAFAPLDGSAAEGRIVTAADRNGNTLSYAYDPAGRLVTATDTLGREVDVAYDASSRVRDVTDFTGRVVHYEYYDGTDFGGGADDLRSVTTAAVTGTVTGNDFPDGKTTTYTYSTGFPDGKLNHNLLTITDAAGHTFHQNVYTSEQDPAAPRYDRLDRQLLPDGSIGYAYAPETPDPLNGFAVSRTIVNDRAGNVTEYLFDAAARLVVVREFSGRAPQPHLPSGVVSNRPVDPLRPEDPPQWENKFDFNADHLWSLHQAVNGNQTQWTYDSDNPDVRLRGNLLQRVRIPGPLGGDQPQIVENWEHGTEFGTLRALLHDHAASFEPQPRQALADFLGVERRLAVRSVTLLDDERVEVAFSTARGLMQGGEDPASNWYRYAARPRGVLRATSRRQPVGPLGRGLEAASLDGGFPTSYTDGRGNAYVLTYDAAGNLETITSPAMTIGTPGQTVVHAWQYNPAGQLQQYTSPEGRVDQFSYHTFGPQSGYLASVIIDAPNEALTTTFGYDDRGNVVSLTDPGAHTTTYEYNQRDQLVRVTRPAPIASTTDFYYDADDNVVRADVQNVDENGLVRPNSHNTRRLAYDALDRLILVATEVGPGACVEEQFEYDANGNVIRARSGEATNGNQPGNELRLVYDERDLLFEMIRGPGQPEQSTDRFDYDGNRNLVARSQGLEDIAGPRVTTHAYDGYDRRIETVDAEGNVRLREYDENGSTVSRRIDGELEQRATGANVRLYEDQFQYDEVNRLIRQDVEHFVPATGLPVGDGVSTTLRVWAADSRLIRVEDDNLHGMDLVYDTVRRPSTIVGPRGDSIQLTYDADSRPVQMTETDLADNGADETFVTVLTFDERHRPTSRTDNLGHQWQMQHDSRNNVTRTVDARGNVVRHTYDGMNRLVRTERDLTDTGDGGGSVVQTVVTERTWDDNGRLASITDDRGNTITHEYDALDRRVRSIGADDTEHVWSYDVHHNPVSALDPNGSSVSQTYDGLNRLVSRAVTPGAGVSAQTTLEQYGYDGVSRLVRTADDDSTVERSHDSLSNVIVESQRVGLGPVRSVTATHDGVGNVLTLTYRSGRLVTRTYDPLDRPATVATGLAVASYDYVGPYRVESVDRGNDVRTDYVYDGARRPVRVHHHSDATLADTTLAWDPVSKKTVRDLVPHGMSHGYEYDSLNRLVRSVHSDVADVVIDYVLDGTGNRVTVLGGPDGGSYESDSALPEPADFQVNQYTSTPTGDREHDRNGNTTGLAVGTPEAQGSAYDYRGRLVSVTSAAGTSTYRYDALGRRIERVSAGGDLRRYYHHGSGVIEEQDAGDSILVSIITGGGGLDNDINWRFEATDLSGNGSLDTFHLLGDDVGATVAVTDEVGAVVERYDYGDYGRVSFFDGAGLSIPQSAVDNPYLFKGLRYDADTGLYLHGARYLDPAAGRFLTRDPLGTWGNAGHLGNAFSYSGTNPWSDEDAIVLMDKAELVDLILKN